MRQLRKLQDLKGYSLDARDGEIGKLNEIYFNDEAWVVRYFVVQTGDWLSGREVLIAPRSVTGVNEDGKHLSVDLTRDKVENSPPVEAEKPVSRHYEEAFFQYYGWERYWIHESLFGPASPPPGQPLLKGQFPSKPEHPHLRSSEAVRGYHIQAQDGEIGHVEDFILDDLDWKVSCLDVDTRNWLPGKRVLLASAWIVRVSWADRMIHVDLDRSAIKTAPEYDPSKPITPDYEVRLCRHYGRQVGE